MNGDFKSVYFASQFKQSMYYLSGKGAGKLHSVVLKQVHNDCVFIVAVGYGGGGVFEEFCGKFKWSDDKEGMVGLFSAFHDPDEWETEVFESDVVSHPGSLIEKADKDIVQGMVQDLWEKYVRYDEATDTRLLRDAFLSADGGYSASEDWDEDVVAWVSNHFWGLTLTFDW